MHTVSASTFWLPCMTLHYTWIVLLMVMDHATLCLSHLLYPCDLLISNPWHYAVSRSSPWWTCAILHSICIILLITFDPKLCLCLMMPSCLMPSYVYIVSVITTGDSESVTRCECMSCYSTTVSLTWQCEQAFTLSHLSDSHVCCCC